MNISAFVFGQDFQGKMYVHLSGLYDLDDMFFKHVHSILVHGSPSVEQLID